MPTTDCVPIMYVEGVAGWGCIRQNRLSLDLTAAAAAAAASGLFARRGSPLPLRNGGDASDGSHHRLERRGAISYEKTDKDAIYLRKLGDARAYIQMDAAHHQQQQQQQQQLQRQQQRRLQGSNMDPIDKGAMLGTSFPQQKPKYLAEFIACAHGLNHQQQYHQQQHQQLLLQQQQRLMKQQQRQRKPRPRTGRAKEQRRRRFVQLLDDCYELQAKCQLAHISTWSFDVFSLDKTSKGRSLFLVTLELFQQHGLVEYFSLDMVKLMKFAALAEDGYHQNPYHNAVHAADVTQAMHCYLIQEKIHNFLTPLEKLAALVAAITHDLDHPGFSQAFLVATSSPLATLYKNNAVLENHHWRSAMGLLQQSGVISHFGQPLWKLLEEQVKSLILATDMSRQQEFFTRFKTQLDDNTIDLTKLEDRHFLLQIALKCADISNTCRPWSTCRVWSEKVCEEFFQQGDQEKKLQLPVTNLCDRNKFTVPKIQIGFIDYVVAPLFRLWERFTCSEVASQQLTHLMSNRQRWQDMSDRPHEADAEPKWQQPRQQSVKDINENTTPLFACHCSISGRAFCEPGLLLQQRQHQQQSHGDLCRCCVSCCGFADRTSSIGQRVAKNRDDELPAEGGDEYDWEKVGDDFGDEDDDERSASDCENSLELQQQPTVHWQGDRGGLAAALAAAAAAADLDSDEVALLAARLVMRRHSTPVPAAGVCGSRHYPTRSDGGRSAAAVSSRGASAALLPPPPLLIAAAEPCALAMRRSSLPLVDLRPAAALDRLLSGYAAASAADASSRSATAVGSESPPPDRGLHSAGAASPPGVEAV